MTVLDFIEKLKKYPETLDVRVLNAAIEDDNSCPTFEVKNVTSAKEDDDFEGLRDLDFVYIEFVDEEYVNEEYLLEPSAIGNS